MRRTSPVLFCWRWLRRRDGHSGLHKMSDRLCKPLQDRYPPACDTPLRQHTQSRGKGDCVAVTIRRARNAPLPLSPSNDCPQVVARRESGQRALFLWPQVELHHWRIVPTPSLLQALRRRESSQHGHEVLKHSSSASHVFKLGELWTNHKVHLL